MKKTTLIYIVTFMMLAMTAIITLQFRFLDEAYGLRSYIFDQTVNSALANVVKKVEKEEALNFVKMKISTPQKIYTHSHTPTEKKNTQKPSGKKRSTRPEKSTRTDKTIYTYAAPGTTVHVANNAVFPEVLPKFFVSIGDSIETFSQNFNFEYPAEISMNYSRNYDLFDRQMDSIDRAMAEIDRERAKLDSVTFILDKKMSKLSVVSTPKFSMPKPLPLPPLSPSLTAQGIMLPEDIECFFDEAEKENEPARVFEELATEMRVMRLPLKSRVNTRLIDSLLRDELIKHRLTLPYKLKLNNNTNDSIYFVSTAYNELTPSEKNIYKICLFEEKGSRENAVISVYFPKKNTLLLNEMRPALISSSILFLMISLSLAYVLRSILKQKKLSEMKNDFINNMTHEFKTPVSTILLASEALKDPLIVKDENRLQRLAGIIYDENLRMSEHVERVLNMAKMEREELKLLYNAVDLHELIQQALQKMELQLNARHTNIKVQLNAINSFLYADELHLKNIIFNLIDNANKYSGLNTTITIETQNVKSGILLNIKDEGIGMNKEQLKRIFEPFYRVPTGNLHNVKGFGLGLHYVYSIIKKLNGTISVKSEPDKGTEFSIYLPFNLQQ